MEEPDEGMEASNPHKYGEKWPSADYAYKDGYQHGYFAAENNPRKEKAMDGIASDKVNIHVGGGGESGGGAMAAVIAALGNRNQGGDTAALLAALGNRNQADVTPALIAALSGHDRHRGDDGFGAGGLWPILLLALLRGRGGFGGGDDCGNGEVERPVFNAAVLSKLGTLEGLIPNSALETQNALQGALASLALGTQQGFSNVKDTVQALGALLIKELCDVNQNVSSQGCQTRERVDDDGDKTRSLLVARFQLEDSTRISELNARLAHLETHGHGREAEFRITQTVNQNQAQAQQQQQLQAQFDHLFRRLGSIEIEQNQIARNTNANLIIGSQGVATGAQSANPVNVR